MKLQLRSVGLSVLETRRKARPRGLHGWGLRTNYNQLNNWGASPQIQFYLSTPPFPDLVCVLLPHHSHTPRWVVDEEVIEQCFVFSGIFFVDMFVMAREIGMV